MNLGLHQCKDRVPATGPSRNSFREVFKNQVRAVGACDFILVGQLTNREEALSPPPTKQSQREEKRAKATAGR